jgi:hypothetical protein
MSGSVQIDGVGLERILVSLAFAVRACVRFFSRFFVELRDAMCDERDHVEPTHALLLEQAHGERVSLCEEGDEDVGAAHVFFSGRLDVSDRAPNGSLYADRRAGVREKCRLGELVELLVEEAFELLLQLRNVPSGVSDHARRRVVEEQRVEQMLHRDELVPALPGLVGGEGQRDFDFRTNPHYSGSAVRSSGIPCCLA